MEKSAKARLLAELESLTGKVVKDIDHDPDDTNMTISFTDGSSLEVDAENLGVLMLEVVTPKWVESDPASLVTVKDLLLDLPENSCINATVDVRPIVHNHNLIILQFGSWSINLKGDGTWLWEDITETRQ